MDKRIVGVNAGNVWHVLNEVKRISIPELAKKLNLSVESTALEMCIRDSSYFVCTPVFDLTRIKFVIKSKRMWKSCDTVHLPVITLIFQPLIYIC